MTEAPLKYLSEKKLSELKKSIVANRDRYEAGDFLDLEHDNGWAVETSTVQVDHDLLATLDGTASTAAADDAQPEAHHEHRPAIDDRCLTVDERRATIGE